MLKGELFADKIIPSKVWRDALFVIVLRIVLNEHVNIFWMLD